MIRFAPGGQLDIATDPSDLPFQIDGKTEISGAMVRCTNLNLDKEGVASTRDGITNLGTVTSPVNGLIVQAGVRYTFGSTIIYKDEASIATGLTSAKWSSVLYNAYNVTTQAVFALNGTDRKRIEGSSVYEWGIAAPTVKPTLVGVIDYGYMYDWELDSSTLGGPHATGNVKQIFQEEGDYVVMYDWEKEFAGGTGVTVDSETQRIMWWFEMDTADFEGQTIGVKYTYVRKSGTTVECESNGSPVSTVVAETGLHVTWTAPSDSQVTHIRLYRTTDNGATYYYSDEYAIAVTTGALTKADGELSLTTVPSDHDRPPLGTVVAGPDLNGYLFIIINNKIRWSKPKQPEYWPTDNEIEISDPSDPGTGMTFYDGNLYASTKRLLYQIQGSGTDSFFPIPLGSVTGALGSDCLLGVKGVGILHVANDGLWLFNGAKDENVTKSRFGPIMEGTTKGSIPGAATANLSNSILKFFRNKLYFGYPSTDYPDEFLVWDFQTQRVSHYDWNSLVFRAMAIDYDNKKLIGGAGTGVYNLEDLTVTDDAGTDISWQLESKAFSDQLQSYFPRAAKWDVDVTSGSTAIGRILLNETIHQSHTLNGSRNTKKRIMAVGNGQRLAVRVDGTGPVDIYAASVE